MPKVGKKKHRRFQPYLSEEQVKDDADAIERFVKSSQSRRRNAATEDEIKTQVASVQAAHLHDDIAQLTCADSNATTSTKPEDESPTDTKSVKK